jgi:formylglycine-generating enzyme required for sulfatase activity
MRSVTMRHAFCLVLAMLTAVSGGREVQQRNGIVAKNSVGMTLVRVKDGFTPFYIGATEVTQRQWQEVMGNNPSTHRGLDLPVQNVRFIDAQEFCDRLSKREGVKYRLPAESEWTAACRAGSPKRTLPDEEVLRHAWCLLNSFNGPHRVGTKIPNGLGIHDMLGNVEEWCSNARVRGGSFLRAPIGCNPERSSPRDPTFAGNTLGFRVVLLAR